nr:putative AC transposase [Tanacetum cinerariifolium]
MAMDIISVQATLVASESAFSTSGRVLSIRRTRLTPASLEMCMCLNDHLDSKERKQGKCPLEIPLDFEEDVFDDEMQQNEAILLSDEEIALDASSEGTLFQGGPQHDYIMGSEAKDDYKFLIRRLLSIRRTRLTLSSLEMCMCLNDHLDAKERKQDKCPFEIPLDFEEDAFDDEMQRNEAISLSDEEIALDASSEGTLSPGGPRYACVLNDHLDAKERKQDKCPLGIPLDFEEDVFDDEMQRNKAISLSDEEIALDTSSEGTMSPAVPQYDYMMSSEAEDDY